MLTRACPGCGLVKTFPARSKYCSEDCYHSHGNSPDQNNVPITVSQSVRQYERALVIGDLHIPFEDQRAVELAIGVADAFRPDIVFLNGDILDCWLISRFTKNPALERENNLHAEFARGRALFSNLRKRFPLAQIKWIFGNHEYRWARYIADNARELHGLKGMTLAEQLDCAAHGVEVIDSGNKENSYLWGKLLIGHFDRISKHSAYTAKLLLDDKSISLIQNHTHRGGSSFRRLYDRDIVGYENFCLCDRSPNYVDRPNWNLGFSLVYKDRDSDFFSVDQHPILARGHNGRTTYQTFFHGVEYNA